MGRPQGSKNRDYKPKPTPMQEREKARKRWGSELSKDILIRCDFDTALQRLREQTTRPGRKGRTALYRHHRELTTF